MSLVRFNPWFGNELESMNHLFRKMIAPYEGKERMTMSDWSPVVDIAETKEEYTIHAELPGLKKEEVKVRVKDGMLTIEGERKTEKEEKGKKFHRVERSYGSFMRAFTLPEDANVSKLLAEFKDGMLFVHIPRSELPKSQAIDVPVR